MIKLLPEQVAQYWDIIKYALEDSPPLTARTMNKRWLNNILTSALSGEIDVWVSYEKEEKNIKLNGIVLTCFEIDKFVKEKSLLIYYLYTYNNVSMRPWISGLKSLVKYAKARNCKRVVAYSNVSDILSMSEKIGGNIDTRFIIFSLGD